MKPNFALDLRHDGIGLLHRGKGGWTLVGEVALSDPDLPDQLDMLRKTASDLEKGGVITKLVIPNSQILYTTVEAPGPDDIAREVQIRAALEGMTPYKVGDLVFDWRARGKMAKVAVLARETLDEAESFAAEHRFNPVSFVARPDGKGFAGEVFFGRAKSAGGILGAGEQIERDETAVPPLAGKAAKAPGKDQPQDAEDKAEVSVAKAANAPASDAHDTGDGAPPPAPPQPPQEDPEAADARLAELLADVPEPQDDPGAKSQDKGKSGAPADKASPKASKPDTPDVVLPQLAPFPPTPEDGDDDSAPFLPPPPPRRAKRKSKPVRSSGPAPEPTPKPEPTPNPEPESQGPKPAQMPEPKPDPEPVPEIKPEPKPEPTPDQEIKLEPKPEPQIKPEPKPDPKPEAKPGPTRPAGAQDTDGAPTPEPSAPTDDADATPAQSAAPVAALAAQPDMAFTSRRKGARLGAPPMDAGRPARGAGVSAKPASALPPPPPRRDATVPPPLRRDPAAPSTLPPLPGLKSGNSAAGNHDTTTPATTGAGAEKPGRFARFLSRNNKPADTPAPKRTPAPRDAQKLSAAAIAAPVAAPPPDTAPDAAQVDAAKPLFGARARASESRGKPRYLGLILTLVLLLAMALVALWSVFFLPGGETSLFQAPSDNDFAAAAVPEPIAPQITPDPGTPAPRGPDAADTAAAPLAPGVQTEPQPVPQPAPAPAPDAGEPLDLALLNDTEPEPLPDPANVADPLALPATPEVLSDEAAEARYASTGIWQKAPLAPEVPGSERVDDLYIASIDPQIRSHDAVALPQAGGGAPEARPDAQLPPPPPGARFALDDAGLVTPTPEGTLSPDGILIFSGPPPIVAPPRPGGAAPAPAAQPDLPRIRPKPRPTGLVENNERAQLGGRTRTELAALRPRPRPVSLQAEAAAGVDTTATAQAIALSPRPDHRPSGFSRVVATARSNANASDGSTVTAAAAPATVTPSIPTRANVAREATVSNAIRLNRINLIGIYGSSASRRALVRLSSGRYVKVSVGDRLNGGKVVSITDAKLVYKKNGKNHVLEVLPLG